MAQKRPRWLDWTFILLAPIVGLALGVALTVALGVSQKAYSNLIVNLVFLAACAVLLRTLAFSREDLGLKFFKQRALWHVISSTAALGLYLLFYLFVIRISGLKPFTANTVWALLGYLVVALVEELYFRGMLYRFLEKRFSARTALIATSLLFGLLHARQGLRGMLSRTFSGWLWGSVRYSSKMTFLLIFPVHWFYNSAWVLFEGKWGDPPAWAVYALPAGEFVLGLSFALVHDARARGGARGSRD